MQRIESARYDYLRYDELADEVSVLEDHGDDLFSINTLSLFVPAHQYQRRL
jgi:hypothetical protein